MKITILFGTESGNAELIAEDLSDSLSDEHEVQVVDLADADPSDITADQVYFVVCSTHGEGDLPESVQPFHDALLAKEPDLSGVRYAMFGLGDTYYEDSYSQGSEHIDRVFTRFGAVRVGEYGRHDASSWDIASDLAIEWSSGVLTELA